MKPSSTMITTLRTIAKRTNAGLLFGIINRPDHIVRAYGQTDKLSHGYMPYYQRHFGPLRSRKNLVIEIGVGGFEAVLPGGSLRVWRDYFSRSTIIGLDLHEKNVQLGSRVVFRQADQSSHEDLGRVVGEFGAPNIVIDDGSHIGRHIYASFEFLFPKMPSGSWYVIEDLSTSFEPDCEGGNPPPQSSAVGLLKTLACDVQSLDPAYSQDLSWIGQAPTPIYSAIAELHVYPGIAFILKA